MNKKNKPAVIDVFFKPGITMDNNELEHFINLISETSETCFDEVPPYQVFKKNRDEMKDKVISVAWKDNSKKQIDGFCSSVLLPVKGIGEVLHLGLTCVRPEARNRGLTHLLTHRVVASQLIKINPLIGKLWISNCAAVISSLVNVSLFFEKVYPSPFIRNRKRPEHTIIAESINKYYRDKMYINSKAEFDEDNFIFRGSVKDTVFQKDENDARYHHRNKILTGYYKNIMNFEEGDEVLQIGYASTFAAMRHILRINTKKIHPQYIIEPDNFEEEAVKSA